MKGIRITILIIILAAIAVVYYTIYGNTGDTMEPIDRVETVTQLDDSTYHVNLSDYMCATLQKNVDTLLVHVIGNAHKTDVDGDTIKITKFSNVDGVPSETFKLCYHDYFTDSCFNKINVIYN